MEIPRVRLFCAAPKAPSTLVALPAHSTTLARLSGARLEFLKDLAECALLLYKLIRRRPV